MPCTAIRLFRTFQSTDDQHDRIGLHLLYKTARCVVSRWVEAGKPEWQTLLLGRVLRVDSRSFSVLRQLFLAHRSFNKARKLTVVLGRPMFSNLLAKLINTRAVALTPEIAHGWLGRKAKALITRCCNEGRDDAVVARVLWPSKSPFSTFSSAAANGGTKSCVQYRGFAGRHRPNY